MNILNKRSGHGQKIGKDDLLAIERLEAESARVFWRKPCRCGHLRKFHGATGKDRCDRNCECNSFEEQR